MRIPSRGSKLDQMDIAYLVRDMADEMTELEAKLEVADKTIEVLNERIEELEERLAEEA